MQVTQLSINDIWINYNCISEGSLYLKLFPFFKPHNNII
jgi:hypothetical protein